MKTKRATAVTAFTSFIITLLALLVAPTLAADATGKPKTLFINVNIFDGVHEKRIENANVLIEGNLQ